MKEKEREGGHTRWNRIKMYITADRQKPSEPTTTTKQKHRAFVIIVANSSLACACKSLKLQRDGSPVH